MLYMYTSFASNKKLSAPACMAVTFAALDKKRRSVLKISDTDLNGESLKPRNSIETYLSDNKQRKPTDIKKGLDKHAKRARTTMSTTVWPFKNKEILNLVP